MTRPFDLFLFSADPTTVERAVAAGIAGAIVDWERVGKRHRQAGADTQIGEDTIDDLRRVRACASAQILCRIDHTPSLLDKQIEAAVEAGADEILVPMVRSAADVERVMQRVGDRCGVGILVETESALDDLHALSSLPLTRAYVGLNDLAIERGSQNIFAPLIDGTLDEIRSVFEVPFGLAGLTVVDAGTPIPARLLIGELVRLGCTFSFLRRSYHADIRARDPAREIPLLFEAIETARARPPAVIAADRDALADAVDEWSGVLASR